MKIIDSHTAIETIKDTVTNKQCKKTFVIAIDGRASSGKTTFAAKLQKEINAPVISTDNFFRPRVNGKIEMTEFAGNFDLNRFKSEIIDAVLSDKTLEYGVFDCKQGRITHNVKPAKSDVYIVEGAYSLHPNLSEYADIKVFFTVNSEIQKDRIINRNGKDGYDNFKKIWIPAEERYLEHFDLESKCDYVVDTSMEVQNGKLRL